MSGFFKKFFSTVMVILSLSTFSACEAEIFNIPTPPKVSDSGAPDWGDSDNQIITNNPGSVVDPEIGTESTPAYLTTDQVRQLSEALGAKSDSIFRFDPYGQDNVTRLAHKNGEPLTISFTPTVSDNARTIATQTIDELFDLLYDINDNYTYEIVEYDENNQSDIVFNNRELQANGGAEFRYRDLLPSGEGYIKRATVHINERALNSSYSGKEVDINLKHTIAHELLHVFGLADVYLDQIGHIDATTLLYVSIFDRSEKSEYTLTHITPNDYKNLISLYAKPSDNLEDDIETYQDMAESYTNNYYKYVAQGKLQDSSAQIQNIENGTYTFTRNVYVAPKTTAPMTFTLSVSDNQYTFVVTDQEGNIMEQTQGVINYLNLTATSEDGQLSFPKAMAIMEGFNSKYIFKDVNRDNDYQTAFSNILLYNVDGKIVFKDALNAINTANPTFKAFEQVQEKE